MKEIAARHLRRASAGVAALVLAAAMTAACAGDADDNGSEQDTAGLTVNSPGEGETVTVPFRLQIDTEFALGPAADELHHLHVWFGDNQTEFDLYESASPQIDQAPAGETTMWVQVHTYDHQPATDPVPVTITVSPDRGS